MKKNSAIKTVGMMMVISLAGRILGLIREVLTGYNFGAYSPESIAFSNASLLARNFLDAVFASVITASFIPIFNQIYETKGQDEAYKLSNTFITIITLSTGAVVALAMLFATPIMNVYMDGQAAGTRALAAELFRIMLPLITLSGIAFSLTGIVQCLGEFNIPSALSVIANGLIITYLLFFVDKFGVVGLAWVFLVGWASQVLVQVPFLIKNKFRFRPNLNFKSPGLSEIGWLMLPVMISTWAVPINSMVSIRLANKIGASVPALNYGNTLFSIITGVFILSLSNLLFPQLSRLTAKDDYNEFGKSIHQALRTLFFFLIPMTVGLILLSRPIVRMVCEYGAFDSQASAQTASVLIFYSVGMVGYGLQTVLSRGFYAMKDGKTPLYTSVLAIAANLVLSLIFLDTMGLDGLALASSLSVSAVAAVLMYITYRRNPITLNASLFTDIIKMLAAVTAMAAIVYSSYTLLTAHLGDSLPARVVILAIPILMGFTAYMSICYAFKINEATIFFGLLKGRAKHDK